MVVSLLLLGMTGLFYIKKQAVLSFRKRQFLSLRRKKVLSDEKERCSILVIERAIYHAYLRWLKTQGVKVDDAKPQSVADDVPSRLRDLPELNSRRAPGNTCLSALESGAMGTVKNAINNSKGGGVMRVAPIGLVGNEPFETAMDAAAITHGHPTGYLSAGVLALIINQIASGKNLGALHGVQGIPEK